MEPSYTTFQHVSFTYNSMSTTLLDDVSLQFATGWTGVVGANGAGKTTILRLATGELAPQTGSVHIPGPALYCQQRTDNAPASLVELLKSVDPDACEARGRLEVDQDWPGRWDTLSHGERKRAQVAVALWLSPAVLAVDEPTNHLDFRARDLVAQALEAFFGIGLLVSHDRELLDRLCAQCLFVDPPRVTMRPGGYSVSKEQSEREREYGEKQYDVARRDTGRLAREVGKRRDAANRADRKRSKRGLPRGDTDAREKIDRARVTGKDGVAGRRLRQLDGRLQQARERLDSIEVTKRYETGIWMQATTAKCATLFRLPSRVIPLGAARHLIIPELEMRPGDRIALTGPNGAGKSTLVRHTVRALTLTAERLTYVPQEIDVAGSQHILDGVRRLSHDRLGQLMTIVSRLGSRPPRLLETEEPSPGELRKLLLALGIVGDPYLILMDEPTNHMDLPSVECLEEALADCPCGLLLVSHDRRFLERVTRIRWHITVPADRPGRFELKVQV